MLHGCDLVYKLKPGKDDGSCSRGVVIEGMGGELGYIAEEE